MHVQIETGRGLSEAQLRFLQREQATPGMRSTLDSRLIYMYRDDPGATHRWLVDNAGEAVDVVSLRRSAR